MKARSGGTCEPEITLYGTDGKQGELSKSTGDVVDVTVVVVCFCRLIRLVCDVQVDRDARDACIV